MSASAAEPTLDTRGIANPERMRLRVRFTKNGKVRFVSHRDLARLMERAFRKLKLPVAYTEGFSPRPKFSFGLALSVGHESDAEYLDVELATKVDIGDLPARLTEVLPDGVAVVGVCEVQPGKDSLQQAIGLCRWEIETIDVEPSDAVLAVEALMASPEVLLERERKGKATVADVRPAIVEVNVLGPSEDGTWVAAVLATTPVSLRPAEFVAVLLGPREGLKEGRVRRTHQFIIDNDERREPVGSPRRTTCASRRSVDQDTAPL